MSPCVLFDLDGTLTDPREGIVASFRFALGALGVEPPGEATLLQEIGPPLAQTFSALLPAPSPARVERAIALYRERFGAGGGWRENRLLPGIPELLAGVEERGWRVAIATSKRVDFAERIVDHFRLRPPIAEVYGSGPDGRLGSKPELLAHALDRLGASDPREVVLVGDRRHDVEGARAVGISSIGVTWGFGDRAELEAAGATWICDSPDAVLATLERVLGRSADTAGPSPSSEREP